jgi:hypothetical protein
MVAGVPCNMLGKSLEPGLNVVDVRAQTLLRFITLFFLFAATSMPYQRIRNPNMLTRIRIRRSDLFCCDVQEIPDDIAQGLVKAPAGCGCIQIF